MQVSQHLSWDENEAQKTKRKWYSFRSHPPKSNYLKMNCKVYFYQLKKFSNCKYKKVLWNIQNQISWDEVQDFHPKVVFSSFKSWWWTWCIVYKSKLNGFRSILRLIENENTCTLQKSLKENENTCARNPSKRAFSSLKSHW